MRFTRAETPQNSWESPLSDSFESGYSSLIRGWACEASTVTATLDGESLNIPYGSERPDTEEICGDSNNGYALAINWNDYGDGDHQIALAIDGLDVVTRSFRIATPGGQGTVSGVQSRHDLSDFPNSGDTLTLQWSEPHQNYRIVRYIPNSDQWLGDGDDQLELTGTTDTTTRYLDFGGRDTFTLSPDLAGPIKVVDRQATTVILPEGLRINAAAFLADGLRFTINGYSVTLLGAVDDFTFVFAGEMHNPSAGISRTYAETAAAFGASIPAAGAEPILGAILGTIQRDGRIAP